MASGLGVGGKGQGWRWNGEAVKVRGSLRRSQRETAQEQISLSLERPSLFFHPLHVYRAHCMQALLQMLLRIVSGLPSRTRRNDVMQTRFF